MRNRIFTWLTNAEEKDIIEIVQDNLELLKMKWNEYFNK